MKWYFALSGASIDVPEHDWRGLVRVAVCSAMQNTTLRPHLLYDGEENAFTTELREMGVEVVPHRVSFHKYFESRGDGYRAIALGAFLRVEIPEIEQEDEFVLYTDCDVVFRQNPKLDIRPRHFAVAPEFSMTDYEHVNSGVMLMNVPALRAELPQFVRYIKEQLNSGWSGFDQENYRKFYQGRWDRLDPLLNWKPYWGSNLEATILHWHGPKPTHVRKLLGNSNHPSPTNWKTLFSLAEESYRDCLRDWDRVAACTHRCVTGHMDDFDGEAGRGWALIQDNPQHPLSMALTIDGEIVAELECSGSRPDLLRQHETSMGGFNFVIPARFRDGNPHRLHLSSKTGRPYALLWNDRPTTEFDFVTERLLHKRIDCRSIVLCYDGIASGILRVRPESSLGVAELSQH